MSLIQWLKLLWNKFATKPVESDGLFALPERLIYRYSNGKETINADPMSLYKKMMSVGPELNIDMKVANSAHSDAPKAHEAMLAKIRSIFGVKSFEEGGLTQIETMELLDHFLVYCDRVKKNGSQTVTSPEATSTVTPPSPVTAPTTPTSGSGSTANEPSTGVPQPSPSVPVSPSA